MLKRARFSGVTTARFTGRRVAMLAKIVKPGAAAEREGWLKWCATHVKAHLEIAPEDVTATVFEETG